MSLLLSSCMNQNASLEGKLLLTDLSGTQVKVSDNINRIAALSTSNALIIHMLNGSDKIIATTQPPSTQPWYVKLNPELLNIPILINRDTDPVNIEELFALNPDIVVSENELQINQIRRAGLDTIYVNRTNFENIKQSVTVTAQMLNNDSEAMGNEFIDYFDEKINKISFIVNTINEDEKPRVFFSRSSQTSASRFVTFGNNTIVDEWIRLCGGINIMHGIEGSKEMSVEEFIASDPDIILIRGSNAHGLGGGERIKNDFLNDPALSEVAAIRNRAIYLCPVGFELWSTHSVEMALHIQWASQIFHPDLFEDTNIIAEAGAFYKRFFDIDFSDDDIERILLQLNPGDILPKN